MIKPHEKAKKLSKKMKDKRKSQEFREETSKRMKKVALEKWEDPEYRAKQLADRKTRSKNPEFRAKMKEISIKNANNPEIRKKISKTQKKNFQKPARKQQHLQMVKDTAEQRRKRMKEKWSDPYFVYRIMKARTNNDKALDVIEKRFGEKQRKECEKILEGN